MSCPCTAITNEPGMQGLASLAEVIGLASLADYHDATFQAAYALVLAHEGGKVDNKKDPGGRTAYGVTQRTFTAWLKSKRKASRDVFTITPDERAQIYYEIYKACGADRLQPQLAIIHFDTAVNFGASVAKKLLAQAGGSVAMYDKLRRQRRAEIIEKNPALKVFSKGWNKRDTATTEYAMAYRPGGSATGKRGTTTNSQKPEWG